LASVLGGYDERVAGLIGPHSTEAVRQAGVILSEVAGAVTGVSESPGRAISLPYAALGCLREGDCPYEAEVFYPHRYPRQPHWVLYPQSEPDWLGGIGARLARSDAELMSEHLEQPTASIVLPSASEYPFWETSLGPLRVKTRRLRQIEEHGLGFHPEHEVWHAIVQDRWPELYYLILNRLNAYDEALADIHSMRRFRWEMVGLERAYLAGITPAWEETRSSDSSHSPDAVTTLPNGHPVRRVRMFAKGGTLPGAVFFSPGGLGGELGPSPETVVSFGNGLHEAYAVELTRAGLVKFQPMEFADLLGRDFCSERYLQTMCLALFFGDFFPAVSYELRKALDSRQGGRLTLADLAEEPEMVTGWLEAASPDGWYRLYGYRGVSGVIDDVFDDLQTVAVERRHDLLDVELPELEELFWRHLVARLITESYPFKLARAEENPRRGFGTPTSPREVARVVEALARLRVPLRDNIERAWLKKGGDYIRRRLRKATFVTLPGRE
jgi:hypothetical protein